MSGERSHIVALIALVALVISRISTVSVLVELVTCAAIVAVVALVYIRLDFFVHSLGPVCAFLILLHGGSMTVKDAAVLAFFFFSTGRALTEIRRSPPSGPMASSRVPRSQGNCQVCIRQFTEFSGPQEPSENRPGTSRNCFQRQDEGGSAQEYSLEDRDDPAEHPLGGPMCPLFRLGSAIQGCLSQVWHRFVSR